MLATGHGAIPQGYQRELSDNSIWRKVSGVKCGHS